MEIYLEPGGENGFGTEAFKYASVLAVIEKASESIGEYAHDMAALEELRGRELGRSSGLSFVKLAEEISKLEKKHIPELAMSAINAVYQTTGFDSDQALPVVDDWSFIFNGEDFVMLDIPTA